MSAVALNNFTEDSTTPSVSSVGSFVATARKAALSESNAAVTALDWQERAEELLSIFDTDHPTTTGSFGSFLF